MIFTPKMAENVGRPFWTKCGGNLDIFVIFCVRANFHERNGGKRSYCFWSKFGGNLTFFKIKNLAEMWRELLFTKNIKVFILKIWLNCGWKTATFEIAHKIGGYLTFLWECQVKWRKYAVSFVNLAENSTDSFWAISATLHLVALLFILNF